MDVKESGGGGGAVSQRLHKDENKDEMVHNTIVHYRGYGRLLRCACSVHNLSRSSREKTQHSNVPTLELTKSLWKRRELDAISDCFI